MQLVIPSEKDSFIVSGGQADNNFGSSSFFQCGFAPLISRFIAEFTLPLPLTGENITGASLTLDAWRMFGSGPSDAVVNRCVQSGWKEYEVTWNQWRVNPGGGAPYLWDTPGGDMAFTPCPFTLPGSVPSDVVIVGEDVGFGTSMETLCVDAINNRGRKLILIGRRGDEVTGFHRVLFRSREYDPPFLTIYYSTLLHYQRQHRGFVRGGLRGHI